MIKKSQLCLVLFTLTILLSILVVGVSPAFAEDDEWDYLVVVLSPENPVFSIEEYSAKAIEFDGYGMVWVEVSKRGKELGEVALEGNSTSWSYMDDRNIRLRAGNVSDMRTLPMFGTLYSPKAEIVFEIRKQDIEAVALDISLNPDEDEYFLDDEVIVGMELRNIGDIKADMIHLEVDSDGLIIRESCPETIFLLDKESQKSCDIKFKFPSNNLKDTYNITVKASWIDNIGEHSLSENTEIQITQPLKIHKSVCSETYLEENVYVSISVENVQKRDMKVKLIDILPSSFTLVENQDDSDFGNISDLNWEFVLAPEERKSFSYCMKPEQLGGYRIPEAHAYIDFCGKSYATSSDSENNVIRVYRKIIYREYDN